MYFYVFMSDSFEESLIVQASQDLTGKGTFGRLVVWEGLVNEIIPSLWWGHCSNCNTEFVEGIGLSRNLSSHNTFLELVYRSGLVGLGLFLVVMFKIADRFLVLRHSPYARIGAAYLFASLWVSTTYEYIMFSFISVNILFWIVIALLIALSVGPTRVTKPLIQPGDDLGVARGR